jgi:hypothetical protein
LAAWVGSQEYKVPAVHIHSFSESIFARPEIVLKLQWTKRLREQLMRRDVTGVRRAARKWFPWKSRRLRSRFVYPSIRTTCTNATAV